MKAKLTPLLPYLFVGVVVLLYLMGSHYKRKYVQTLDRLTEAHAFIELKNDGFLRRN